MVLKLLFLILSHLGNLLVPIGAQLVVVGEAEEAGLGGGGADEFEGRGQAVLAEAVGDGKTG